VPNTHVRTGLSDFEKVTNDTQRSEIQQEVLIVLGILKILISQNSDKLFTFICFRHSAEKTDNIRHD
jgi:hypothetical protein